MFLPLLAVTVIIHAMRSRIRWYRQAAREAAGGVTGFIGEMFGMIETIKVSNAESRVIDEFNRVNKERGRTSLRDEVLGETLNTLSSNAHYVGTGILLALLARAMSEGALTVGDLSLLVFYLTQVQAFGRALGGLLTGYRRVGVSVDRLLELMPGSTPEALVEPTPSYLWGRLPEIALPSKSAQDRLEVLEVDGLTYVYPEVGAGVHDVSFRLERGEFTVVTGRVGAGKTTLLRTLVGWLPAQRGRVSWNGSQIGDADRVLVPPRCAYLSQVPRLFSEQLRANILMGLPEQRVDLQARSAVIGAGRDGGRLGHAGRAAGSPGGQQRRSGRQGCSREPELLVLDDVSNGLDLPEATLVAWRIPGTGRPHHPIEGRAWSPIFAARDFGDGRLWAGETGVDERVR